MLCGAETPIAEAERLLGWCWSLSRGAGTRASEERAGQRELVSVALDSVAAARVTRQCRAAEQARDVDRKGQGPSSSSSLADSPVPPFGRARPVVCRVPHPATEAEYGR